MVLIFGGLYNVWCVNLYRDGNAEEGDEEEGGVTGGVGGNNETERYTIWMFPW